MSVNSFSVLKLNLGCGFRKRPGYVNVDVEALCQPDVTVDLENQPWPFADSSVSEVVFEHALEHLGETKGQYFHVIKELYRVCTPGARVQIIFPHHRHDNFFHDCTHVRVLTAEGLAMFSKKRNEETIASGGAETCLGLYLDVNFEIQGVEYALVEPFASAVRNGQISDEKMHEIMRTQCNICQEVSVQLRVIK